ncbi:MAG TPA: glycosyltransferase family 4 protein [Clostridiales bacterium]|nr:glycosyltransferase family 4 protein [Clostridiales bacterium]
MKSILYTATVEEHFLYFYLPYFEKLRAEGYRVDCACKNAKRVTGCDKTIELAIERSPLKLKNILAFAQLRRAIKTEKYDLVHCGTPVAGFLTRLAVASLPIKGRPKLIYTAHGFHFYKGAPPLSKTVFFLLEYLMAFFTDYLITINDEDYRTAKKYFKQTTVERVKGVGYSSERFAPCSKEEKAEIRKSLGLNPEDQILVYVAELNKNKNQELLIDCLKKLDNKERNFKLLLVGEDRLGGKVHRYAKRKGISDKIQFLGVRSDVDRIIKASDVLVASSQREGLPVNVMEGLACGLPVIATDNRGHRELVKNGYNGFLTEKEDYKEAAKRVMEIFCDEALYGRLSKNAVESVKDYGVDRVFGEVKTIYDKT